jgi:hypothetical protein
MTRGAASENQTKQEESPHILITSLQYTQRCCLSFASSSCKILLKTNSIFKYFLSSVLKDTDEKSLHRNINSMNSLHWINVGARAEPGAKLNPFTILLNSLNEDDFVYM